MLGLDRNALKFSLDSSVGRAVDCSGYRALMSTLMCGITRALLRLGYPSVTGSIPVREIVFFLMDILSTKYDVYIP